MKFIPKSGSLWLVVVECNYDVVRVCVSGKGFYIPGQEPCWSFDHVREWIKEIVPKKSSNLCPCCSEEHCPVGDEILFVREQNEAMRRLAGNTLVDTKNWFDDWIRSCDDEEYPAYIAELEKIINS